MLQESEKQKDELREILDGHIAEIHNNVRKTVQVFEECSLLLKQTNFEVVRVKVAQQIQDITDKLLEFESVMSES